VHICASQKKGVALPLLTYLPAGEQIVLEAGRAGCGGLILPNRPSLPFKGLGVLPSRPNLAKALKGRRCRRTPIG